MIFRTILSPYKTRKPTPFVYFRYAGFAASRRQQGRVYRTPGHCTLSPAYKLFSGRFAALVTTRRYALGLGADSGIFSDGP